MVSGVCNKIMASHRCNPRQLKRGRCLKLFSLKRVSLNHKFLNKHFLICIPWVESIDNIRKQKHINCHHQHNRILKFDLFLSFFPFTFPQRQGTYLYTSALECDVKNVVINCRAFAPSSGCFGLLQIAASKILHCYCFSDRFSREKWV